MLISDSRAPLPSDEAIVSAIVSGKIDLLRIYVHGSLHHLYTDTYGRNFLHLAATERTCAIVTIFHTRSAKEPSFNIDTLNQYKATALHAVCGRLAATSHVETIKSLLDAGANPTLKYELEYTPGVRARRTSQGLWDSHVKTLFTSTNVSDPIDLNVQSGIDANFRDVFKGQTHLQRAEELKEKAARVSNDELLARNDANIMKDKATWDKHRDSTPEVVRRDAILKHLRRLQDNKATTSVKQAEPGRALTALVEKLNAINPGTLLSASSIEGIVQRIGTPYTSIGHRDMWTGPSSSNPGVALQMYEWYNVGNGVVTIVVATVLGAVAVAIASIVSQHSEFLTYIHFPSFVTSNL
jgi:hypothetical protein